MNKGKRYYNNVDLLNDTLIKAYLNKNISKKTLFRLNKFILNLRFP